MYHTQAHTHTHSHKRTHTHSLILKWQGVEEYWASVDGETRLVFVKYGQDVSGTKVKLILFGMEDVFVVVVVVFPVHDFVSGVWSPPAEKAPTGKRLATLPRGSSARDGLFSTRGRELSGSRTVPRRSILR